MAQESAEVGIYAGIGEEREDLNEGRECLTLCWEGQSTDRGCEGAEVISCECAPEIINCESGEYKDRMELHGVACDKLVMRYRGLYSLEFEPHLAQLG